MNPQLPYFPGIPVSCHIFFSVFHLFLFLSSAAIFIIHVPLKTGSGSTVDTVFSTVGTSH
jgi:hypothetical protein